MRPIDIIAILGASNIQTLTMINYPINTFDIDGVIFINKNIRGVYPGQHDIIVTGRSLEECPETEQMLRERGIYNPVIMNPLPFDQKSRASSGVHKGNVIKILKDLGINLGCHFEDDEIQIAEIKKIVPDHPVVHLVHDLTIKENVRHPI